MTISAYQIDNILKAYSRQSKVSSQALRPRMSRRRTRGTPTWSRCPPEQEKPEVYDKISYSLMDVILKGNKSK